MDCFDKELRIAHLKKTYGLTDAEAERRVQIGDGLVKVAMKQKSIGERLREVVSKARREGKLDKIEHNDHDS